MYPEGVDDGMPIGSFVTCSSDDTIRVWNLDPNIDTTQDPTYRRNIYSNVSMIMKLVVHFCFPDTLKRFHYSFPLLICSVQSLYLICCFRSC